MNVANAVAVFTPGEASPSAQIAGLAAQLAEYRRRLVVDPQLNPVRQLAFDISRALESGEMSVAPLIATSRELCDRALVGRAEAMRAYLGVTDLAARDAELAALVEESAWQYGRLRPFAEFAADWARPTDGIVFTGHPTFAMPAAMRAVLVGLIDGSLSEAEGKAALDTLPKAAPVITLEDEHVQAQTAIAAAQAAAARIATVAQSVARRLYPDEWRSFHAAPIELSSWIGYDLDGRTDITWQRSLMFRLAEKRRQLARYLGSAEALAEASSAARDAVKTLGTAIAELDEVSALFADAADPGTVSAAANRLTAGASRPLHASIADLAQTLGEAAATAQGETAAALAALAGDMRGSGLGTARIHLRINAMQLHNAIRKTLNTEGELTGLQMLARLDRMIREMHPASVNFATAAIERATAVRQFILMAQILKHVDGDAPIRLLIAECEQPVTVLAALYFARLFGIAERVDISPLFETPAALDGGARIIEELLEYPSYRDYVTRRGRLSIQTGFSDAGRFMGQVPAALAVERLHRKIGDVVTRFAPAGVDVLMFDTHGESMGRGGHPTSIADRFDYTLSPKVRQRYWDRGIRLTHETSFQGGDGYVLFGSLPLAYATMVELAKWRRTAARETEADALYNEWDFARDLYEAAKDYQTRMFANPDYRTALGAFSGNLLPPTGSRKSERQFDGGADGRALAAAMRAIPNNAILQQLGYVLNVVSGLGWVLRRDAERFVETYHRSDRLRRIIRLVAHAKRLSSIKTLVAYSALFDDAFWVTRPLNGMEREIKEPCLYLAGLLRGDGRRDSMMHLATLLREDAVYLHDLLTRLGFDTRWPEHDAPRVELDVLHAVRIALIQRIFLLAARIPPFSTRNDVSRDDIMRLVLALRIDEALTLLRQSFPIAGPSVSDYQLDEPADYAGDETSDYAELHDRYFNPIAEAYGVVRQISIGISHHFRAHG